MLSGFSVMIYAQWDFWDPLALCCLVLVYKNIDDNSLNLQVVKDRDDGECTRWQNHFLVQNN